MFFEIFYSSNHFIKFDLNKINIMKQKILKLRSEGKTYNEIVKKLGCPKSLISYYCGDNQKKKWNDRLKKYRSKSNLITKLDRYKGRKMKVATRDFQRRNGSLLLNKQVDKNFNHKDVIKKFGVETFCYLSGEKINLIEDTHYSFDHITPVSKGGINSLKNLGVLHKKVNSMKDDLTVDEFIGWCKKILEHNGYEVKKTK